MFNFKKIGACFIATALIVSFGVNAHAETFEARPSLLYSQKNMTEQRFKANVSPAEFKSGLDDLVAAGKLKLLSSKETSVGSINEYGILDLEDKSVVMTFSIEIPKYQERISAEMWDGQPAITFDMDNQKAIATGGAAAVTAMAAAAAAALAETVVGSIISAGAIAFFGGVATSYISDHGHCPTDKPILKVGVFNGKAECK